MNSNIKEIFKKFWFVILVGALLVSAAIYFAWNTNKNTIAGETSEGKDVIFDLDNKKYTADEYYDDLYSLPVSSSDTSKSGVASLYSLFEKEVISQSVEVTDKMEEEAKKSADSIEAEWRSQYGNQYEDYMGGQLKKLGYEDASDLETMYLDQLKAEAFLKNTIYDDLSIVDEMFEKESPRVISHILVKFDDAENPSATITATEQAKIDAIQKRIDAGDKFEDIAADLSEDTASAADKGSLGLSFKNGTLVAEFEDAAWNLKKGEMSGWVKTTYGYHLIKVDATDKKEILENKDYKDYVANAALTYDTNLRKKLVWKKAEKLKVKFNDDATEKAIKDYIGISEK